MTADQPLQPGDRVLIEAVAIASPYGAPGTDGPHLQLLCTYGGTWENEAWDPNAVRWRPLPAATTAHPAGDRDFAAEIQAFFSDEGFGTTTTNVWPERIARLVAALGLDDLQAERDRLGAEVARRDATVRLLGWTPPAQEGP